MKKKISVSYIPRLMDNIFVILPFLAKAVNVTGIFAHQEYYLFS